MDRVLLLVLALMITAPADSAELNSPQQQFKSVPSRIADIPGDWATANPLRLQVCFNTRFAVNSPQADEFLRNWFRSISAMPFDVQLRMERVIYPAKFAYCASLTYKNWQVYRDYDASEIFLKYYHEQWQPAVTEAEEQLTVLDAATTTR
jgi:hypothetical protein